MRAPVPLRLGSHICQPCPSHEAKFFIHLSTFYISVPILLVRQLLLMSSPPWDPAIVLHFSHCFYNTISLGSGVHSLTTWTLWATPCAAYPSRPPWAPIPPPPGPSLCPTRVHTTALLSRDLNLTTASAFLSRQRRFTPVLKGLCRFPLLICKWAMQEY